MTESDPMKPSKVSGMHLTDTEKSARKELDKAPRPRIAATVVLTIGDRHNPKILMGQRSSRHDFMPSVYVFPGGRVDRIDSFAPYAGDLSPRTERVLEAAVSPRKARAIALSCIRETYEETGLMIGAEAAKQRRNMKNPTYDTFRKAGKLPDIGNLEVFGRAITPPHRHKRFDAWFLPREIGKHPEDQEPISAGIGRYGPYVVHQRTFASLSEVHEVWEVGLNRAVTLIEEKKASRGKGRTQNVLKDLGKHPTDEAPVQILDGRYGPYVKWGKINATIPNGQDPQDVNIDMALEYIAEKEAKGAKKKPARKKPAAKTSIHTGTAGVLGGGVDHIYPKQNTQLHLDMRERGLLVSESPLGYRASARDFPRRNRLISGLSLGVVVIEAAERSGTLITARYALEQNREVMAAPGSPLDPRTKGCNRLIRQGAALIETAQDVLDCLEGARTDAVQPNLFDPGARYRGANYDPAQNAKEMDRAKEALLSAASYTPTHRDDIIRASGVPTAIAAAALLEMELNEDVFVEVDGRISRAS